MASQVPNGAAGSPSSLRGRPGARKAGRTKTAVSTRLASSLAVGMTTDELRLASLHQRQKEGRQAKENEDEGSQEQESSDASGSTQGKSTTIRSSGRLVTQHSQALPQIRSPSKRPPLPFHPQGCARSTRRPTRQCAQVQTSRALTTVFKPSLLRCLVGHRRQPNSHLVLAHRQSRLPAQHTLLYLVILRFSSTQCLSLALPRIVFLDQLALSSMSVSFDSRMINVNPTLLSLTPL